MEPIYHVSPSQLSSYLHPEHGCPRKWAFRTLEKREESPSVGKSFGTELHARAAAYLATGADVGNDDVGQALKYGIRPLFYLPLPGPHLLIESEFVDHQIGFDILGRADCVVPPVDKAPLLIVDHKTTKDPRYILTEDELREDYESIIYSANFMRRFGVSECENRWLYFITPGNERPRKAKGCKPVSIFRTLDETMAQYNRLVTTAAEMVAIRKVKPAALDLPARVCACSAFAGCSYKELCNIPVRGKLIAMFGENKCLTTIANDANVATTPQDAALKTQEPEMSLLEKLRAEAATKAQTAPVVVAPVVAGPVDPPVASTPPPAQDPAPEIDLKQVQKKRGAKGANPPPVAPVAPRLTLYIDCMPVKGENQPVLLADLLAPLCAQVAAAEGVPHWSLIDYAKGGGYLAAALAAVELPPSIYINSYSAEAKAVIEQLTSMADVVVRAVR